MFERHPLTRARPPLFSFWDSPRANEPQVAPLLCSLLSANGGLACGRYLPPRTATQPRFMVPWWQLPSVLLHRIPNEAREKTYWRLWRGKKRIENTGQCVLLCVVWAAPVMRKNLWRRGKRDPWVRQQHLPLHVATPQSVARDPPDLCAPFFSVSPRLPLYGSLLSSRM